MYRWDQRMRRRGAARAWVRLGCLAALILCAALAFGSSASAAGGCTLKLYARDVGDTFDGVTIALYRIGGRTGDGWALASPAFDTVQLSDEYKPEELEKIEGIIDATGWEVAAQGSLTHGAVTFDGLDEGYYFVRKLTVEGESEFAREFTMLHFTVRLETSVEALLKYALTTEARVEKRWLDDAADGNRPGSVTVRLMRRTGDGLVPVQEEAADAETGRRDIVRALTAEGGWQAVVDGLPKYEDDMLIEYVWREDAVARYTLEGEETAADDVYHAFTTVITNAPERTRRILYKYWQDVGDQDGVRPDSIRVQLLADGRPWGEPTTLSADDAQPDDANTWRCEWTGLPVYSGGKAIAYTVEELDTEALGELGYASALSTPVQGIFFTITNTHAPIKTSVPVSKVWDDARDYDGIRPEEIQVTLLKNGSPWSANANETPQDNPVTLRAGDDWMYTWTGLDRYASGGQEIDYTVLETPVEGYTSQTVRTASGSWIITNTHAPKKGDLRIVKQVTAGGRETTGRVADGAYTFTVTGPLGTDRETTFSLPVRVINGRSAVSGHNDLWHGQYVIREETPINGTKLAGVSVDGKTAAYDDGVTVAVGEGEAAVEAVFTNDIEVVSVSVNKAWAGETSAASRPAAISVRLMEGSRILDTQSLSADNGWRYTWQELPKFDPDGRTAKVYTVDEISVRGYTSDGPRPTSGPADVNYLITNTFVSTPSGANPPDQTDPPETTGTPEASPTPVPTTEINGEKVWRDDGNVHGLRPEGITIELLANDVVVNSEPVWRSRSGDTWRFSFTGLPAVDAEGAPIRYALRELPVEGYTAEVEGYTIVNTLIPRMPEAYTDINGVKTWDDANNVAGARPNYITLHLLRDGVETGEQRTVTAATEWQYTFQNQPRDDGYGHTYAYAVREDAVPGYFARMNGFGVLNARLPETIEDDATPLGARSAENLEELLVLFDYSTPLFGDLLQTGDEMPVYPIVFGGAGALALLALLVTGRRRRRRYD